MKIIIKLLPSLIFFILFLSSGKLVQVEFAPIIQVLLAAVFIWAHVQWTRNSISSGLVIVVIITIVFPISVLYFLSTSSETWPDFASMLVKASKDNSPFLGFEWFFPLLGSVVSAYIMKNQNKSLKERDV